MKTTEIPIINKLQLLQTECNKHQTVASEVIKPISEVIMRRMAYVQQIYEVCQLLRDEEKKRQVSTDEYHAILDYCRRFAYFAMRKER